MSSEPAAAFTSPFQVSLAARHDGTWLSPGYWLQSFTGWPCQLAIWDACMCGVRLDDWTTGSDTVRAGRLCSRDRAHSRISSHSPSSKLILKHAAFSRRACPRMQIGFCTALDTQASQAFGAGDMHGVHAVLVTALVLCVAAALPMVAGLLVAQQVAAVVFRQPPAIAARAGQFCARLAPGVVPQVPPRVPTWCKRMHVDLDIQQLDQPRAAGCRPPSASPPVLSSCGLCCCKEGLLAPPPRRHFAQRLFAHWTAAFVRQRCHRSAATFTWQSSDAIMGCALSPGNCTCMQWLQSHLA